MELRRPYSIATVCRQRTKTPYCCVFVLLTVETSWWWIASILSVSTTRSTCVQRQRKAAKMKEIEMKWKKCVENVSRGEIETVTPKAATITASTSTKNNKPANQPTNKHASEAARVLLEVCHKNKYNFTRFGLKCSTLDTAAATTPDAEALLLYFTFFHATVVFPFTLPLCYASPLYIIVYF